MSKQTYFQQLNQALKNYERAIPCLLIDVDRLDNNIARLKKSLKPATTFRIVVKSLPSPDLLEHIMQVADTQNLMVFHQPFLTDLSTRLDEKADILLGKPMPIKTANFFYKNVAKSKHNFNPYGQIQWLVDTEVRIKQYIELAKALGQQLRLNIEIDVGLHRGGFMDLESLKRGLELIEKHPKEVNFSGLMGYDPHVVKLPSIVRTKEKALRLANTFYHDCKALIQDDFPNLWRDDLTFNGGGSPTLSLHQDQASPLNDIAAGSCLVMPTTFDIPTLKNYEPACYIATPVLKKFEGTTLPALEGMKNLLNVVQSTNRQSYFIYGGFWKADYCYPEGIQANKLFGASTNQTMLNAPANTVLEVDDFVFLRPHQSEFVLLHFGELLPVKGAKILEPWRLLKNS